VRLSLVSLLTAGLVWPGACAPRTVVVHATGAATERSTAVCFLLLTQRVVGGGRMSYCLERFTGEPGPSAVVHDSGVMTFALSRGTVRARVAIVQRFERDGAHARQTLTGTLIGGTGSFRGARGTIAGGGTDVERPPGHVESSNLRYVLRLRGSAQSSR
jgi:hypothetical protein